MQALNEALSTRFLLSTWEMEEKMAGRGRFGKYGDLKRKEQIRSTRLLRAGQAREKFTSARAVQEDRPGRGNKKK